jgi:hypothetical protein
MLKEGQQSAAPVVIALIDGKAAGDRLAPAFVIDESRIGTLFAEPACWPALEGDYGVAVGDGYTLRSIFTRSKIYYLNFDKTTLNKRGDF